MLEPLSTLTGVTVSMEEVLNRGPSWAEAVVFQAMIRSVSQAVTQRTEHVTLLGTPEYRILGMEMSGGSKVSGGKKERWVGRDGLRTFLGGWERFLHFFLFCFDF